MSDSTNTSEGGTATVDTTASNGAPKRRGSGLSSKLLPELQQIAGDLGISGTAKMRKSELIAAIQGAQGGSGRTGRTLRAFRSLWSLWSLGSLMTLTSRSGPVASTARRETSTSG